MRCWRTAANAASSSRTSRTWPANHASSWALRPLPISTHFSGMRPLAARAAKAGRTMRRARSPVAPNSTKIVGGMPAAYVRGRAGAGSTAHLVQSLLTQRTQVDRGPCAEGPPSRRDVRERAAVALRDLGVEPALMGREGVGGVRTADDDQVGR